MNSYPPPSQGHKCNWMLWWSVILWCTGSGFITMMMMSVMPSERPMTIRFMNKVKQGWFAIVFNQTTSQGRNLQHNLGSDSQRSMHTYQELNLELLDYKAPIKATHPSWTPCILGIIVLDIMYNWRTELYWIFYWQIPPPLLTLSFIKPIIILTYVTKFVLLV